jgi:hypothetical protein
MTYIKKDCLKQVNTRLGLIGSITANGLQISEGKDLENEILTLKQNLI